MFHSLKNRAPRAKVGVARRSASAAATMAGFATCSIIGALSPLIVIPAVVRGWGADGWASIAVGQSIGAIGSVVIMWGWAIQGPVLAARADSRIRLSLLVSQSLQSRLVIALFALPVSGLCAVLLAPDHRGAAGLTAIGMALSGLSMVWYFVGSRKPALVLLYDSLPKLLIAVLASLAISSFGILILYPVILVVGTLIFSALSAMDVSGAYVMPRKFFHISRVSRSVNQSLGAGLSQIASAVYINGAVALVAVAGSAQTVANFAAVNRLYLAAVLACLPVFQFFAGWVAQERSVVGRRARVALGAQFLTSILAIPAFIAFAPLVGRFLFGDVVEVGIVPLSLTALGVAVVIFTRAFGSHVLLANGGATQMGTSAIAGAIACLVLVPLFAKEFGVSGACGALLAVESVVLVVQLWYGLRILRRQRGSKVVR